LEELINGGLLFYGADKRNPQATVNLYTEGKHSMFYKALE
jgi:hypothetical protein